LRKLDMPAYVLATKEDHIVPWKTAYASARLLRGKVDFVLSASGHIAGVVNPASRNRRNFWLGGKLPKDPERWFAAARPNLAAGGRTGAHGLLSTAASACRRRRGLAQALTPKSSLRRAAT
jgi:hypothetical protein